MGLFDKKYCDICGEKIGLLGNRKLEDGNMCKDCAKKLSPFCDDRRHSTIEQIKAHLQYREQNKTVLRSFNATRTFGEDKKIYLDMANGTFVVSRHTPGNWAEENPDVIPVSQINSITLDIDEDRDEIYTQGKDGQRVSYNPPRYKYYYNFDLKFLVNNPYFDDFTVRLNNFRIEGMGTMEYNRYQQMAMEVINTLTPGAAMNMGMNNGMMNNGMGMGMNNGMMNNGMGMGMNNGMMNNGMGMGMNNGMGMNQGYAPANGMNMNQGYAPANGMNMNQGFVQQPQQGMPQSWFCPNCGAQNNGSNFCSSCGTKRQ